MAGTEELASIQELLAQNLAELGETRAELTATRAESAGIATKLDLLTTKTAAVEEKLPGFVQRSHFWLAIAALVAVILLALGVGWKFRRDDYLRREREKVAQVAEKARERADLLRGCERGNDARASQREMIHKAFEPGPAIPTEGLPPAIQAYIASQPERSVQRRDEILALPGVQPVDCEMAFPPPEPVSP